METNLTAKMEPLPLLSHRREAAQSEAKVWETDTRSLQRALIEAGVETDSSAPRKG